MRLIAALCPAQGVRLTGACPGDGDGREAHFHVVSSPCFSEVVTQHVDASPVRAERGEPVK